MADFTETMRQWKRMCDTLEREYADSRTECDHCPLDGCAAIWEAPKTTDWDEIADKVLAWAKENPEPVYPTWWEWLKTVGIVAESLSAIDAVARLRSYSIPADIAEKLGIKPKIDQGKD